MKIDKSLLAAMLLGISVGGSLSSCDKVDIESETQAIEGHEGEPRCGVGEECWPSDPCPTCGMG